MKITLSVDEVKKFIQVSDSIKLESKKFSPVLSYLKLSSSFGECTITKSSQFEYCRYSFDSNNSDFETLIEYDALLELLSKTKATAFTIETDGKFVHLKDGYYHFRFSTSDAEINNYPIHNSPNESAYERLNIDSMKTIQIARGNTGNDKIREFMNFIYIDKQTIYWADTSSVFAKKIEENYSFYALSLAESILLSKFNYVDISVQETWNVYRYENAVFGFKNSDGAVGFNYAGFLSYLKRDNFCTINVEDLMNFCTSTLALNKDAKICTSLFNAKEEKVDLEFSDLISGLENKLKIKCGLVGNEFSFNFEPRKMIDVIKPLPYNEICLGKENGIVSIWNSKDISFLGFISMIHNKTND